jgi:pimeloyl-ACP methyl ester carboxylesterase
MNASGGRRVLLLHGLWMPGASMHWLGAQLRAQGFAPETFGYHSVADGPDLAVPRLVERLRDGEGADIVAHSLGGLIALQALRETPGLPVGRVVCIGSPLTGSGAATGMLRWGLAANLLGRSAALLQEGVPGWHGRAEIGVIAGRVRHGLGALFAGFDGDHDGTVAVAETRLEGVADHMVMDASHTGLLLSAEVAAQAAAFLEDGRFRH